MPRFGIEEEFILLDRTSLGPVPLGLIARDAIRADRPAGTASAEFLTCQVEYATSPVADREAARAELNTARRALSRFATAHGAIAAGTGTPFGSGEAATISPTPRYQGIGRWLGEIVESHHSSGLHVHTEVVDDEARIRASNSLRAWLPVLLALTGNSPFWGQRDTGYRSWRSILLRRLPTMGAPPVFHDMSDYRQRVAQLIRMRAAPDAASVAWSVRLSDRFPTVEVRVFDAQLDVDDTLFLAVLTRALVTTAPVADTHIDSDVIDASLWMAAREGWNAALVHPLSGEISFALDLFDLLLRVTAPALQQTGDLAFVEDHFARLRLIGTGAERQLAAVATAGAEGLRALYSGIHPVSPTEGMLAPSNLG